jgi:membrane protein
MRQTITFFKEIIQRINKADVTGLSAQIAYFMLLSLFPFLLFLVTLMGFIPIDSESFLQFLSTFLPTDVLEMIETNLTDIVESRNSSLLSLSILGTLWSASNGLNAITKSFNKAYKVEENRSFLLSRLTALGLMFGLVIIIALALVLAVFGRVIGEYVFSLFGLSDLISSWNVIRWVITSVTFFIGLFVLYKLAPNQKVKANEAVWGTLFATIAWQITSLGFSFYVDTLGNYSATYGSLGTVIILMIWLYLLGIIITTGGVLNAYMAQQKTT